MKALRVKKGFTLTETLIAMAVVGVIVAMTMPTLMISSNKQKYITSFKKAASVMGQALTMNIALNAMDAQTCTDCTSSGATGAQALKTFFQSKLSVLSSGSDYFYTADGMYFKFFKTSSDACGTSSSILADSASTNADCYVLVDVNGKKGPDMPSTGTYATGTYNDQYYLIIKRKSIVPGYYINNSNSIAQDIMLN
jgi:prepilin-type N-terminal cleavage/methylation domain-containing protein